jgi:hypothetical protein
LVLEVAVVRLCRRDAGPPLAALAERVERLERGLGAGAVPAPASSAPVPGRVPGRTVGGLRGVAKTPSPPVDVEAALAPDEPGPASPAPTETPAAAVDLDDVVIAWASILPSLPVATRSAVQDAQPIRVDGDVVVFGVPPGLLAAAQPRFRGAADTIRAALSSHLGRALRFKIVGAADFVAPPAAAGKRPARPTPEPEPEPDDELDIRDDDPRDGLEVQTDPDPRALSSVDLLAAEFGATVIEEVPRD